MKNTTSHTMQLLFQIDDSKFTTLTSQAYLSNNNLINTITINEWEKGAPHCMINVTLSDHISNCAIVFRDVTFEIHEHENSSHAINVQFIMNGHTIELAFNKSGECISQIPKVNSKMLRLLIEMGDYGSILLKNIKKSFDKANYSSIVQKPKIISRKDWEDCNSNHTQCIINAEINAAADFATRAVIYITGMAGQLPEIDSLSRAAIRDLQTDISISISRRYRMALESCNTDFENCIEEAPDIG